MNNIITYESLRNFAYSNDKICRMPVKGIAVEFKGLGLSSMYCEDTDEGKMFAEKGIIYIIPYNNPWAWMNRQAVNFTDEIIDVLIRHYKLHDDIPIVASGSSMGGLSALVYAVYANRTPIACAANCPVCDLPFHYTERPDLPRTLYSAFYSYNMTFDEALETASPVHLADKMPPIKYYIFHCECDSSVDKKMHSDVFVDILRKKHTVIYHSVPDRDHCDLPANMEALYLNYISDSIEGTGK